MTRGASTEVKSGINVTALLVIGSILWLGFLGCAQCAHCLNLTIIFPNLAQRRQRRFAVAESVRNRDCVTKRLRSA